MPAKGNKSNLGPKEDPGMSPRKCNSFQEHGYVRRHVSKVPPCNTGQKNPCCLTFCLLMLPYKTETPCW